MARHHTRSVYLEQALYSTVCGRDEQFLQDSLWVSCMCSDTDKKEKKIFLIYKEIQKGSGVNSYMRKAFLSYEEMH
jgi:hypothetical protein